MTEEEETLNCGNSCCCVFSVKTGVYIIDMVTFITLIVNIVLLATTLSLWWYFIPQVIWFAITAVFFYIMHKYENEEDDCPNRREHCFLAYLFNVLIMD